MRKKVLCRGLALLFIAVIGGALINPYSRQWLFGPKYGGVPLCAWQEHLRRQVVPHRDDAMLAKVVNLFRPKVAELEFTKLSREDRIAIWLTLLDDPAPAMRMRTIKALWGNISIEGWGDLYIGANDLVDLSRFLGDINASTISVDSLGGQFQPIQPPYAVAPHLLRMLDDPAEEVRNTAFGALGSQGKNAEPAFARLFEILSDTDPMRRSLAAICLNRAHPKSRKLLDRLIAMLDDTDAGVRANLVDCLAEWHDRRMAVAAGPGLVKLLQDPTSNVRLHAAVALGRLRVHLALAIETLGSALRHPDAAVRQQALQSLFDSAGAALFADLMRCARTDADLENQRLAIHALGSCGRRAVALLVTLLHHPEANLREAARSALHRLGGDARAAVPALLSNLDELGDGGIAALGAIGDPAAISRLIDLLDDRARIARVLTALQSFGPVARDAVPKVLPYLRDADANVCETAIQTLRDIGADHPETIPALARLTLEDSASYRLAAISALRHLGGKVPNIVPDLMHHLDTADPAARAAAIQLLGAIGPDAAPAIPILLRLADSTDSDVANRAVAALGAIAAAEEQVIPLLIRKARQEDGLEAMAALGNFGPRAEAAAVDIVRFLKSQGPLVRTTAATTLCRIVRRGEDAVPHLLPLLHDESDEVRGHVTGLLSEFGPAARAAVPALCVLLDDDSQHIYESALDALAQIEP